MNVDNTELLAVMEQQRKLAIESLQQIVIDATRHIEMLGEDMTDRVMSVGHAIAQQESQTIGFAALHAARHDMLLRVLRSEV